MAAKRCTAEKSRYHPYRDFRGTLGTPSSDGVPKCARRLCDDLLLLVVLPEDPISGQEILLRTKEVTEIRPLSQNVTEVRPLSQNVTEDRPLSQNVTEARPLSQNVTEARPLSQNAQGIPILPACLKSAIISFICA